jgi:tetratricopeptide (TPR) repeat protein
MKVQFKTLAAVLALLCNGAYGQIASLPAASVCGDLRNHYGPFDYRTQTAAQRGVVERAHFTPQVEQLRAGQSTTVIGADIAYTLRVFPNHPRALNALSRLALRDKLAQPRGADYPVECYFERAIRFQPQDPGPYLVYGMHLSRAGQHQKAVEAIQFAAQLAPDDANVNYNLGLAYFELKDYENALKHAERAYAAGFPLDGLRRMLKKAGKWQE